MLYMSQTKHYPAQWYVNTELHKGCIEGQRILKDVQVLYTGFSSVKILVVVDSHTDHKFSQLHLLFFKCYCLVY